MARWRPKFSPIAQNSRRNGSGSLVVRRILRNPVTCSIGASLAWRIAASMAASVISSLDAEGRWLAPLRSTSNPYTHDGSKEITPGDFGSTQVGDDTDTSPHRDEKPAMGIATTTYLRNMATLVEYLETVK